MIAKLKEKCGICGEEIAASNPLSLKRVMGFHRRVRHGIPGATTTPYGKRATARARHWRMAGLSPEQIVAREREFLARHPETANNGGQEIPVERPVKKHRPTEDVVPMALKECPFCGSRFYGCRGEKAES